MTKKQKRQRKRSSIQVISWAWFQSQSFWKQASIAIFAALVVSIVWWLLDPIINPLQIKVNIDRINGFDFQDCNEALSNTPTIEFTIANTGKAPSDFVNYKYELLNSTNTCNLNISFFSRGGCQMGFLKRPGNPEKICITSTPPLPKEAIGQDTLQAEFSWEVHTFVEALKAGGIAGCNITETISICAISSNNTFCSNPKPINIYFRKC